MGQLCLLATFVGTGYTAFASVVGWSVGSRRLLQSSIWAGALSFLATTVSTFVLCRALITKDFHFEYVAQYVSQHLGWQYSLSALWVGQAGSLLLWTWFSLALAIVLRCQTLRTRWPLSEPAYGMLMGFCFFLAMVMIFAADPMARNLAPTLDGAGLSPVLQHPVMLIHPPVVFFGYASSAVPAAIAFTALAAGKLDATWTELARPWSLLSWGILGAGILLGARWAYTELGWGGYWGWDPVENGSLVPWLLATATLHSHMTWRRGGQQKKLAVALPIATFAMCNFSTFLTRSGIFSSLHAFSQSPIGWLFLVWMIGIASAAGVLIIVRRESLRRHPSPAILWSRESMILANTVAFIALAVAICLGTMAPTLTDAIVGRKVVIGPQFYNQMLIPTGLLIMLTTGLAPLLRWGAPPNAAQRKMLTHVACTAVASACIAYFGSGRQVLWSVVCGLFTLGVGSIVANWCVDA
ncbi:MAG: cytochrome c biogenesis protein CcsA, partial [Planctomycetales bacterium]|nr:cytochrome c biogenesis protein CcsA [Planctomycetales bacterium]